MTKQQMKEFLEKNLEGMPIERQDEFLVDFIEVAQEKVNELAEEVEKNYAYCEKCNNFTLKDEVKNVREKQETASYFRAYLKGEGSINGTKLVTKKYGECPHCGAEIEVATVNVEKLS